MKKVLWIAVFTTVSVAYAGENGPKEITGRGRSGQRRLLGTSEYGMFHPFDERLSSEDSCFIIIKNACTNGCNLIRYYALKISGHLEEINKQNKKD